MKVTVCIGSSCHLKGSRQVVEEFQYMISENNLKDEVELGGTFCMAFQNQSSHSFSFGFYEVSAYSWVLSFHQSLQELEIGEIKVGEGLQQIIILV